MSQLHPINKILITNIVSLNPGDAAILSGTIDILRKKYGSEIDVVVFDKSADVAQKYYPWASFRQSLFPSLRKGIIYRALEKTGYSHWAEKVRFLRLYVSVYLLKNKIMILARLLLSKREMKDLNEYVSADLILSTGGTYLIENYDLSPAIMDYRISILTGKHFGFFTQSLGPFRHVKNRRIFKNIFPKASVILLRDERSRNHIVELGVESKNIYLAADAAFVFANNMLKSHVVKEISSGSGATLRLAISVRSMKNFHPEKSKLYFESIVQAIKVAINEFGAEVTFLSTCQGIEEYWANDDETADQIYELIPEYFRDRVKVDRKFRQPWEVVKKYQSFDAVIATRMHAAILSLCAGTPTIGLAYEFKMEELFKNIGMGELVINIASFSLDDVTICIQRILSDTGIYRDKVDSAVEKMCKQAWSAGRALPDAKKL